MTENVSSRVRKTKAEWAAVFEAQGRSGRSARAYCAEQGIGYSNFLYHRRKHRERLQGVNESSRAVSISRGFIPIHLNDGASVRLRFPGLVLESDRLPSAAWLVEVAQRWADGEDTQC